MKSDLITTMLVEDEAPAREMLIDLITSREDLILKGVARDGNEALAMMRKESYELLFLDVDLPGLSGFEVLEQLGRIPHVIFTTAHDKYAVRAFQTGAVDYLLKPFDAERFNTAADRAVKTICNNAPSLSSISQLGICVNHGHNHILLSHDDICYLSSDGHKTHVHTTEGQFTSKRLLGEHEESLPRDRFMRIHKKYIVNLSMIHEFQYLMGGFYEVYLKHSPAVPLPVGRKYARLFRTAMNPRKKD